MATVYRADVEPPKCLREPLKVPYKTLMGPGPSTTSPRVLHAMSHPTVGHLHSECTQIMDEIKEGLRYVFQTRNDLTLCVSTSGHGGMEATLANLLERGERCMVVVSGLWGERAADMASRYGADVRRVEPPAGRLTLSLSDFESALQHHRPAVLFVTHGESSTGALQSLDGLGDLCHRYDCLLIVDTVASLLGVPLYMDKWGIDAIYTGSQKVIGAPPGLTPISFSPRAQTKIFSRKTPVNVYYFDMTKLGLYWKCFGEQPRFYHHTIPMNLLYAMREALAIVCEEGIEHCWTRHQLCSKRLQDGIKSQGFELFVEREEDVLPTVIAIKVPKNVCWQEMIRYAMQTHCLEISGGLGGTVGKIFRIGVMGYNATFDTIDYTLRVLKESYEHAGKNCTHKM